MATLNINNVDGKIIKAVRLIQGSSQAHVNINGLATGVYFINVNDGNSIKAIKFVKQ